MTVNEIDVISMKEFLFHCLFEWSMAISTENTWVIFI